MSINAISSVSIYEYYYRINDEKPKESKTAKELKKLGIEPSDSETKNAAMLKEAQETQQEAKNAVKETSYNNRPWADIMDQLGLPFNKNPKDDIVSIKSALNKLVKDIDDEELLSDIKDLDDYVKSLYMTYYNNDYDSNKVSSSLSKELEGISAINKAFVF